MKPVPHDPESERALLASVCGPCSEDHRALLGKAHESDFLIPSHRYVFRAARDVWRSGLEITPFALKDHLQRMGVLSEVGGYQGVMEILASVDVGNPGSLLDLLQRKRLHRQIISLGTELIRAAENELDAPEALIQSASQDLHRLAVDGSKLEAGSWVTVLDRVSEGGAFRVSRADRAGWTGLKSLDDVCRIPAGEVTLIAARPGVGKTALMVQIACESAKQGAKPYIVSLELPRPNAEARLAAYFTGTSVEPWRKGEYQDDAVAKLWKAQPWLEAGQLACPPVGTPWAKLESEIRRAVDSLSVNLVLVDYFSLIGKGQIAKGSSEAYAYAALSQSITALAKELKIGFVLLAQLTKASESKPTLKDLADSDRPSRDAAVTLLLWHDAEGKPWAELAKNRDGRLGWKKELQLVDGSRFSESARETKTVSEWA